MKIGLLEKKVESADAECARQVGKEREETQRIKDIMEDQERSVDPMCRVGMCAQILNIAQTYALHTYVCTSLTQGSSWSR